MSGLIGSVVMIVVGVLAMIFAGRFYEAAKGYLADWRLDSAHAVTIYRIMGAFFALFGLALLIRALTGAS